MFISALFTIDKTSEHVCAQLCLTLCDTTPPPPQALHPWNFPGKSTGVSCHFPLKIRHRGYLSVRGQRNGYTHSPPHFCVILVTCNSSDSNKTPGVEKPGIKSGSRGFRSVNKRFLLLVSNFPVISQRMFFGAFHNTSILLTETHLTVIHVWLQNLIGSRPGRICCFFAFGLGQFNLGICVSHLLVIPHSIKTDPVALVVKNPPANAGDVFQGRAPPLGQEDPLEWEMATHSSIAAWEIPWTEELRKKR